MLVFARGSALSVQLKVPLKCVSTPVEGDAGEQQRFKQEDAEMQPGWIGEKCCRRYQGRNPRNDAGRGYGRVFQPPQEHDPGGHDHDRQVGRLHGLARQPEMGRAVHPRNHANHKKGMYHVAVGEISAPQRNPEHHEECSGYRCEPEHGPPDRLWQQEKVHDRKDREHAGGEDKPCLHGVREKWDGRCQFRVSFQLRRQPAKHCPVPPGISYDAPPGRKNGYLVQRVRGSESMILARMGNSRRRALPALYHGIT